MQRLLVWTLAAGVILLAGGQQAMAKEGHEDSRSGATGVISRVPGNLKPGQAWNATITFLNGGGVVDAEGFRPTITLHNLGTGEVTSVTAFLQRPGVYTARIVFPQAGRWSMKLHNGFDGTIDDTTNLSVRSAPSLTSSSRTFPIWAWIVSGLMSLLLVASAFVLMPRLRRKRVAVS